MKNVPLFKAEDLPPRARYEKLFENMPPLPDPPRATGRPPFSRDAILRALIYKNLRGLPSLTDLVFELENNPVMAEVLGFRPGRPAPSKERLSQFLRTLSHADLQAVRLTLVRRLIQEGVITGKHLALDSCSIKANVKENNLKASAQNRFDKTRQLPGDPDARLGVLIHYPQAFQTKIAWFWGYRNHVLNDVVSELPLYEKTLPANHDEKKQAVPLLREAQEYLSLSANFLHHQERNRLLSRPSGNAQKGKDDRKRENVYPIRLPSSLGEEIPRAISPLPGRPSKVLQPKGL